MSMYFVSEPAGHRIDNILRYTLETWGDAQAHKYINGLFDCFDKIAKRQKPWRTIPPEYGVTGYYAQYEQHFVFWRQRSDGGVSILSVLSQQMNIPRHLRSDEKKNNL